MAINFLYFDLGKVILNFSHEVAAAQMAEVSGLTEAMVRKVVFGDVLQKDYELGSINDEEFHRRFCEATGSQVEIDRLLHAGSDIFSLNLPIVPLLGQLKAAGYAMGLLSNTCSAHWGYVANRFSILHAFFKPIVLSYQVKMAKPENEIYLIASDQAGWSPEQVFFVDDLQENVNGALDAGIAAVQFIDVPQLVTELRNRGIEFNY